MKKMNIISLCPNCRSSRINGTISIKDGRYVQKIKCSKCGYANHKDIGDAKRREEPKEEIDEE